MGDFLVSAEEIHAAVAAAHQQARRAEVLLPDLRRAVSRACQVLVDVELEAARAQLTPGDGDARGLRARLALLERRCMDAVDLGRELSDHLHAGGRATNAAHQAFAELGPRPDDLPRQELGDLACLEVRIDGLRQILRLATPMAESAVSRLELTAQVAGHHAQDQRGVEATLTRSTHLATSGLGRAEEAELHLDRIVGEISFASHRATGHSEHVATAARDRTVREQRQVSRPTATGLGPCP